MTERILREFLSIAKALSDESRVRALMTLGDGELCLCQIIEVLGLSPSTVSKHMHVLQLADLVRRRKEGKWHFYRLAGDDAGRAARRALAWVREELRDDRAIRDDARRLRKVRRQDLRESSACYRS